MDADTDRDRSVEREADSNDMAQTRCPQHDRLPNTVRQTQPDHASKVPDTTIKSKSKNISPFLSLPGEIRNLVYEYYPCIYEYTGCFTLRQGQEQRFRLNDGMQCQPAITRVNRQLRRETIGFFYSQHRFRVKMVVPHQQWLDFGAVPLVLEGSIEKWYRGELDPAYVISGLLRRFTPRVGATIQPSNLRFLTHLSIAMPVRNSLVLSRLEFTMSATVLDLKNDVGGLENWAAVKTDGLNWNNDKEVRAALVEGITSCPQWYTYGYRDLDSKDAPERAGPSDTVDKLACGISLIAKHLPQLANNVYAYFQPSECDVDFPWKCWSHRYG